MGAGAQRVCLVFRRMHPLDALTFSTRVAKRAQYEQFEITTVETGFRIRNESHANPDKHEYTVRMDGHIPIACTCPADERFDGPCKHRVAVAIRQPSRRPVWTATSSSTTVRSDGESPAGGTSAVQERSTADVQGLAEDDCKECRPSFPCWECYLTERRDFTG